MAGIITTIVQKFRTEGAEKATQATLKVGRAQTNLVGGAKAAGREFSAQARGLGGLVAAYAGAAATIFAVQQAFTGLARAAEAQQVLQGTQALANAIGASGEQILKTVQEITKGQLTMVESAKQVNIALSSGFSVTQIEKLSEVSLKAARALGRNLSDAFNRLVRGTSKLEPELLDELGIFTRIEPAVQRYAAQIGKTATSLTNFERRQAFVNAAIEEGERKFNSIDTTIVTSLESLERFGASIVDVAIEVGGAFADIIAPTLEFLGGNVTNLAATFGLLFTLISGTAVKSIEAGFTKLAAAISKPVDALANFINKIRGGNQAIEQLSANLVVNANLMRNTSIATRAETQELLALAKSGEISVTQLRKLNTALIETVNAKKAEIATTIKQIRANKTLGKDTDNLTVKLGKQRIAYKALAAAARESTVALVAQSAAARKAAAVAAFLSRAVTILGKVFSKLTGILFGAIFAFSIITLAVNTIAKAIGAQDELDTFVRNIGEFVKQALGIDEASKQAESGILGIAGAALEAQLQLQFTTEELKKIQDFKFEKDFLFFFRIETTISRKELQNKLADIITEAREDGIKELDKAVRRTSGISASAQSTFNTADRALVARVQQLKQLNGVTDNLASSQALAERSIRNLIDELDPLNIAAFKALKALEAAAVAAFKLGEAAGAVGLFAAETSQTGVAIAEAFAGGINAVKIGNDIVTTFRIQDKLVGNIVVSIRDFKSLGEQRLKTEKQLIVTSAAQQTAITGVLAASEGVNIANIKIGNASQKIVGLQKELAKGQINAEGITRSQLAIDNLITDSKRQLLVITKGILKADAFKNKTDKNRLTQEKLLIQANLKRLEIANEIIRAIGDQSSAIERVRDNLRKTFGSEFKAAENLFSGGLDIQTGILAKTATEQRGNQLAVLRQIVVETKNAVIAEKAFTAALVKEKVESLTPERTEELAKQNKFIGANVRLALLAREANKIRAGLLIKITQELEKQANSLEKQLRDLVKQITLLKIKNNITDLKGQISIRAKELGITKELSAIEINIAKARLDQVQATIKSNDSSIKINIEENNILAKTLDLQNK